MKVLIAVVLLLSVTLNFSLCQSEGKTWVLLVAGSNGYQNYRHQSDIYHAYQVFKNKGVPLDNIIVMHYDDIANSNFNPKPGTVINVPEGPNVYPGVPKDYVGKDVSPDNFLSILSGKDMGPGRKTIKSGPNDRIFIYFADHGAPGLIAFPTTWLIIEHVLHAKDLINTLEQMYQNKQYKEIVFYIEACESGSMFNGLLKDEWNIYATTAANPYESSYACYYSSEFRTYLADCYSAEFLIDTETSDLRNVTFEDQYLQIKSQVNTSHVCQYGTKSITEETLSFFLGGIKSTKPAAIKRPITATADKINAREVTKKHILDKLRREPQNKTYQQEYDLYTRMERSAEVVFGAFYHKLNLQKVQRDAPNGNDDHCSTRKGPIDVDCMKDSVTALLKYCGPFNEANIKYASYLRDACTISSASDISYHLRQICSIAKL